MRCYLTIGDLPIAEVTQWGEVVTADSVCNAKIFDSEAEAESFAFNLKDIRAGQIRVVEK